MKTILLVDDDNMQLRVTASLLTDKYKVLCVNAGKKALILFDKIMPDMILLDYEMPECNGADTLKLIREKGIDLPVVFLTGITDEKTIGIIDDLDAKGYLVKPVSKEQLLSKVEGILGE